MRSKDCLLLAVSGGLLLAWNVVSWGFPFFWDTVLNSKVATWYLETGFSSLVVPERLDAGHPPFFSLYLAVAWKAFGRSLVVAHVAMLPFLFLLLVQYHRLACRWLGPKARAWAMLLLFCEPTFLAQASMVTPDIALVAVYLLALNALLDGRRGWLAVALAVMAGMSFRGILMVGVVFVTDCAWAWWSGSRRPDWKKGWPYVPVAGLTALWLWLHVQATGWLFSPPQATYGGQRELLGLAGMARNAALIGWRWMDFGRVFLFASLLVGGLAVGWRRVLAHGPLRQNLLAAAVFLAGLALLFIPFSNPPGHRYFLVGYLLVALLVVGMAELGAWRLPFKLGLGLVVLGLGTGHLWLYPQGVAQGWDASLAHLPIFRLQAQTAEFLDTHHIAPAQVCADFPLLHRPADTRLVAGDKGPWYRNFLEETDCEWALVSNTNNGYTDAQIAEFDQSARWELREEFRCARLFIRIYHRR